MTKELLSPSPFTEHCAGDSDIHPGIFSLFCVRTLQMWGEDFSDCQSQTVKNLTYVVFTDWNEVVL